MKRKKIWILNLILVLLICALLTCSHIQNIREPEINTDILTPEMEIPAGGEKIDEQADDVREEGTTKSDDNGTVDSDSDSGSEDVSDDTSVEESQEESSNDGDIVTPEF